MDIENVEIMTISGVKNHDPIRIVMQETEGLGRGAGRLIVTEWSSAWVCFWGSMGMPLIEFITSNSAEYLADNLLQGTKYTKAEYKRMLSRAAVIVDELKKYKLVREIEADEVLWDRQMEESNND